MSGGTTFDLIVLDVNDAGTMDFLPAETMSKPEAGTCPFAYHARNDSFTGTMDLGQRASTIRQNHFPARSWY